MCDNTYARVEQYNTVAAKMDESMVNLTSLLEKTFFGESITDYRCDGADCRRLGVNRAARFDSLPECLLIDLNRSAKVGPYT